MMNHNWARWIFASVSSFFDSKKSTLDMFVEGTDMLGRRKDKDYIEFRMNGPSGTEVSKAYWRLDFEVNVLVCSLKDEKNFHRLLSNIGIVTSMFFGAIPIYKLGSGPDDDPKEMLEDCAVREEEIRVNQYGQFDPALPVLQATVESSYKIYLETPDNA
jgi:predicted transport protein